MPKIPRIIEAPPPPDPLTFWTNQRSPDSLGYFCNPYHRQIFQMNVFVRCFHQLQKKLLSRTPKFLVLKRY